MSSLVPSGVEKGIKSQNSKSTVEVTVQETVPDVSHQDEETLEILQGNLCCSKMFDVVFLWRGNNFVFETRTT